MILPRETPAEDGGPGLPATADVAVVGCGAAGLFAAIHAGRGAAAAGRRLSIVGLDGARKLGAKILVSGGGRCNVTNVSLSERDYCGSTPPAIRRVLARFPLEATVAFFRDAGVTMYEEPDNGKLFPVTDSARTILDALLAGAAAAGVRLVHPARVEAIERDGGALRVVTGAGVVTAGRVILCTGGRSLPKSGSDGAGLALAAALGHSIAEPVVPALVPLVLPGGHWIRDLTGLALPCTLALVSPAGKRLAAATGSTLCTHTGLSGPATLDVSRHWLVSRLRDPDARLTLDWLPALAAEALEAELVAAGARGALSVLRRHLTERLGRALCAAAAAPPAGDLPRDARRRLVEQVKRTPLPVEGDRGWNVAEATAGGVPLSEVRLESMESRVCPGLFLAGEILDVDGRIGGFNFQWAWASGFVAGGAAAAG
ncbi:MAG: aminoacetone oxidase family FAD-binding enzyme [Planctomycetaceae bacterium]